MPVLKGRIPSEGLTSSVLGTITKEVGVAIDEYGNIPMCTQSTWG